MAPETRDESDTLTAPQRTSTGDGLRLGARFARETTAPVVSADRAPAPRSFREHVGISIAFVMTRVALYAAGLRFNFVTDWMFLADPADLREHLLETVYYFHAYPPGMNVITGVLSKLGGEHAEVLAQVLFVGFGLVLVNSLLYLGRVAGMGTWARLILCMAFAMAPATLYFEHLYLYEAPVAALLCLAGALFHRAATRPGFFIWSAFFLTCATIGWIRSTFHLVWFGAMLLLGLYVARRGQRTRCFHAALAPAALLLALYVKNWIVFDSFGAASSLGANLAHVTTMQLPRQLQSEWIERGELSPFAAYSIFESPARYRAHFASTENARWPRLGVIQSLVRPSVNAPNYNHWFLLEVCQRRLEDARHYIAQRPYAYARTVLASLVALFEPSTMWHPRDSKPNSPHHQHRRVLGAYERLFNGVVHGLPIAPVGLYLFLPVFCVWALRRIRGGTSAARTAATAPAEESWKGSEPILYFALIQIAFVTLVSSAFETGESSRFRYQIEPMIWLVAGVASASWLGQGRAWLAPALRRMRVAGI